MEERFGVKGTTTDDVFFSEDAISGAQVVKQVKVEISRQNANLREVKQRMAAEAKAAGATAIMNFRYGQKAHKGLKRLAFKWDAESWHGEGDATRI
jgi:hypothetical protein